MRFLRNITLAILIAGVAFGQMPKKGGPPSLGGRRPHHNGRGPAALERFNSLPPSEREQILGKMPPDRRKVLEQRIERYNQMSPQERDRLRDQLEKFRQLPPEQQDEARRVFRRFNSQPDDRQRAMRDEIDSLRKLSPDERRERMNSADFQERFSTQERRIMRDFDQAFESDPPPQDEPLEEN